MQTESTMKHILCLTALVAVLPLALSAGKSAKPKPVTLFATACNIDVTQPCVLVSGSGYASGKSVTIDVEGATSETFSAPVDRNGNFAIYIYESYAPGYYTVTSYQGSGPTPPLMATTGFEITN